MIAESSSSIPLYILISRVLMLSARTEPTFLNLCAYGSEHTSALLDTRQRSFASSLSHL